MTLDLLTEMLRLSRHGRTSNIFGSHYTEGSKVGSIASYLIISIANYPMTVMYLP